MTAIAAASTSTAMEAYVVHASVGVKLFLNETWSDAAHALFLTLFSGDSAFIFVPDLFTSSAPTCSGSIIAASG